MNPMDEVFAPIEAANREAVNRATWGHLAPEKGRSYPGWIVWTHTAWGWTQLIDADFENLEWSPWLDEHAQEFINRYVDARAITRGTIFRFEGVCCNYRFRGRVTKLPLKTPTHRR